MSGETHEHNPYNGRPEAIASKAVGISGIFNPRREETNKEEVAR